jgi:SET domain-containing protein|tara:strand:+ start:681 stop:1139 length:459 start_codon:yes stop_codon:yes gene_type:complete
MIINKYKLLQNLEGTYCIMGSSKVQGVGIIAIRDIPKGVDPLPIIIPEKLINLTEEDLKTLPKEVVDRVKELFIRNNKVYSVSNSGLNGLGIIGYMNHSKEPNVALNIGAFNGGYVPWITIKDIKKGEELFWDYTTCHGDNLLNQFKFLKDD